MPGGTDNDDELWITFGPRYDNYWNEWMVVYKNQIYDQWMVRGTVWWWGNYIDLEPEFTEWVLEPMR